MVILNSQHAFIKGKSRPLPKPISFCNGMSHLVDKSWVAFVVYCDFSKTFDTASLSILVTTLVRHGLEKKNISYIENWKTWSCYQQFKNPASGQLAVMFLRGQYCRWYWLMYSIKVWTVGLEVFSESSCMIPSWGKEQFICWRAE